MRDVKRRVSLFSTGRSGGQRRSIPDRVGVSQLVGNVRWEKSYWCMADRRETEKEEGMCDASAPCVLRFTFHACDVELLHTGFEGCGIETENFGRALLAAHAPVGLLEHIDNMLPFDFFQGQRLRRRGFAM